MHLLVYISLDSWSFIQWAIIPSVIIWIHRLFWILSVEPLHTVLLTRLRNSLSTFLQLWHKAPSWFASLNLYFPSPKSGTSRFSKALVGVFFVGCTFWFMPLGLPGALGALSSVLIFCSECVPMELSRGLYIVKICVFTEHLFCLLTGILP